MILIAYWLSQSPSLHGGGINGSAQTTWWKSCRFCGCLDHRILVWLRSGTRRLVSAAAVELVLLNHLVTRAGLYCLSEMMSDIDIDRRTAPAALDPSLRHQQQSNPTYLQESHHSPVCPPTKIPSICDDEEVLCVSDHINYGHHDQNVLFPTTKNITMFIWILRVISHKVWNLTTTLNFLRFCLQKYQNLFIYDGKCRVFFTTRRVQSS